MGSLCNQDLQFLILLPSRVLGSQAPQRPQSLLPALGMVLAAPACAHFFPLPSAGRKREWFTIEEAIKVLQCHKPVQASYFETLRQGYSANNGTPVVATATYSSSMSGIR